MIDASEFNKNKLGFGLMRLPHKGNAIDIPQTCEMVDKFLEAGLTYFDTAFVYTGSEDAAKKALVTRYPRESYTLATKLYVTSAPNESAAKKEFDISLRRTGAEYFDYYLLHAVSRENYQKYGQFHLWEFVRDLQEKKLIRHWGFSFHDSPALLDKILTEHPEAEFVQLQINYADWDDATVQARENYQVARRHGKPIVIMEPVKGGTLANPPKRAQEILRKANPNVSYASWAIRYAASLDGVLAVLSGMSSVAQMEDNLSYMRDFQPLTRAEHTTVMEAMSAFQEVSFISCTSCHYCTGGCPKKIPIPEIFAARNKQILWGRGMEGKADYAALAKRGNVVSACIRCRQCEQVCPQRISIIRTLLDCEKNLV